MEITVIGPNLNDQSKGQFHVHTTGCADIKRMIRREPEYEYGYETDAESRLELAADWFEDHIAENEPESEWSKPEPYVSEFHFFPCCKDLP